MKVLIVEDDRDQALLTCDALEPTVYQPTVVHTIADCKAQNWGDFGLILLDYQLPDGFGLDLITDIRSVTDMPVIMITGESGLAVEAVKRGASDYIVKTRDHLQTLALTIDKNVEQYRLRQEKESLKRDLQNSVMELQRKNEQLQMAQQQLIEAAKLSAVAQLVTGVAHELNNPLTGIIGFTELLKSNVGDEGSRSMLATIHTLALRCAATVKALATFARQGKMPKGPVGINELLRSCLTLNEHNLSRDDIHVESSLAEDIPPVQGHVGHLQQVFIHIMKNSQQALAEISRQRLLSVRTYHLEGQVFIHIRDNGQGMDQEALSHAFEPFFTTHQVGDGAGLGLSVTYGIIQEHSGNISINSKLEEGTEVIVMLPCKVQPKTDSPLTRGVARGVAADQMAAI